MSEAPIDTARRLGYLTVEEAKAADWAPKGGPAQVSMKSPEPQPAPAYAEPECGGGRAVVQHPRNLVSRHARRRAIATVRYLRQDGRIIKPTELFAQTQPLHGIEKSQLAKLRRMPPGQRARFFKPDEAWVPSAGPAKGQ